MTGDSNDETMVLLWFNCVKPLPSKYIVWVISVGLVFQCKCQVFFVKLQFIKI